MTIAIMQPYLFPYIGYFQLINSVDKFIVYDDVHFIKKGWINRNNILSSGKANTFTIPLREASQNKLINEIYLLDEIKWRVSFLKKIEYSYKKAPFFKEVYPLIEIIINAKVDKITDLILLSLKTINQYIKIKTTLIDSSIIYNVASLKGQERIVAICKKENASGYINPIGGQYMYTKYLFDKEKIKLNFLRSHPITYKQLNDEFVPWLSIIDVIMFNSPEKIKEMLNQYELV